MTFDERREFFRRHFEANTRIGQILASKTLAESDGVTGYSRHYWNSIGKKTRDGTIDRVDATHETLAEMARVERERGVLLGSSEWKALYDEVNDLWRRHRNIAVKRSGT
jgi:PHD/YefM family antitoxin component YafN of YafNO toxin-antitoxin module